MSPNPAPPDRRRQHFERNGGPKLSGATRSAGRAGVAAARRVLAEHPRQSRRRC